VITASQPEARWIYDIYNDPYNIYLALFAHFLHPEETCRNLQFPGNRPEGRRRRIFREFPYFSATRVTTSMNWRGVCSFRNIVRKERAMTAVQGVLLGA
jgi:hypothetical protein